MAAALGMAGHSRGGLASIVPQMAQAWADSRYVQERLGHAQLSTTQLYAMVSIRKLQQVHVATHPAARQQGEETGRDLAPEPPVAVVNTTAPPPQDPVQRLADALAAESQEELQTPL